MYLHLSHIGLQILEVVMGRGSEKESRDCVYNILLILFSPGCKREKVFHKCLMQVWVEILHDHQLVGELITEAYSLCEQRAPSVLIPNPHSSSVMRHI